MHFVKLLIDIICVIYNDILFFFLTSLLCIFIIKQECLSDYV